MPLSFRLRMGISIHAPREGCDVVNGLQPADLEISIHAPREGCDKQHATGERRRMAFQSTHPVRGATGIISAIVIPK